MWTRRAFLQVSSILGATMPATAATDAIAAGAARLERVSPEDAARDESFWGAVRNAFTVESTLINLNNGNSSPSPRVVHAALTRNLELTNRLPVHYRAQIASTLDGVRRALASAFGCEPTELALTRNATEALHIVQCGLDLQRGDEVLSTEHDYTLMLWAWNQRARRDGIVVRRVDFPAPATAGEIVDRFARAITPRTKVMHFSHVTSTTGQLLPVRELARLARGRGIFTIVDGAHGVGHVPFALRDLECDAYGTSLHKWLMAPQGTGFLYVRPESIARIWPLHAEVEGLAGDVRKFEEIGTHATAAWAAIGPAVQFHSTIGAERKAARLRYLTLRWATALARQPRITLLSSLAPGATWGIASFEIAGARAAAISRRLFDEDRIVVATEENQGPEGPAFAHQAIRVTPQIYTSPREIDRFVAAIERITARA